VASIRNISKLIISLILTIPVCNSSYGFSSLSVGGFQGYQVVKQTESIYKTTSTLASLPTFGLQFQFQTTIGSQFGMRFKYENIIVKFQTPPEGFLSAETFRTTCAALELPYQHSIHWQSFIKIARKERVLFNIDDTLRFSIYKSKSWDLGYGVNYDSENKGGLIYGTGTTISVLDFASKDINNIEATHLGVDFEIRAKVGWIYEVGLGTIFRAIYSNFYMPNSIDKNTGREIKFFGEVLKSF
jgi:hypothetical protein